MSDFDKEAEREKLREKYGDETADREATQQMSELLLQGATMTNKHCDTCGDPVFRHQGQEFCPTCQTESGEMQESREQPTGDGQSTARQPQESRSRPQPDSRSRDRSGPETGENPDRGPAPSGVEEGNPEPPASGAGGPDVERRRPIESPAPADGDGGLAEAQRSLQRTLVRFARQAEQAEDPRAAREHLQTAREAAEALSALR